MLIRFLRTSSTRRLLATIGGALAAITGCTAIAVAAVGSGPVPPATTLAKGVHAALSGARQDPVTGLSANVSFTDNLIDSTDLTGHTVDPLLQGATGRLWWTAGGQFRLELQSDDGDAQVLVNQRSWWISDPAQNVVFEGTLPAGSGSGSGTGAGSGAGSGHGLPTIAQIQAELGRLMQRFTVTGPTATDVGGQPASRVSVSPKTSGGLLGSIQLAWDASRGVPLQIEIDARGSSTPVLGLEATSVSYGPVPASVFAISPPAGAHIVHVGDATDSAMPGVSARGAPITGTKRVAGHLNFPLRPPSSVDGLALRQVRLVDVGGQDGALLLYGRGLGTIAATETRTTNPASSSSSSLDGLSLPTRSIDGSSATVLSTPLGAILTVSHGGVAYTVLGSVTAADAESAATALAAGG